MVLLYFEGLAALSDGPAETLTFSFLTEMQTVGGWALRIANGTPKPFEHDVIVINNNRIGWTDDLFVTGQPGGAGEAGSQALC